MYPNILGDPYCSQSSKGVPVTGSRASPQPCKDTPVDRLRAQPTHLSPDALGAIKFSRWVLTDSLVLFKNLQLSTE
jgi:hypothetical protein